MQVRASLPPVRTYVHKIMFERSYVCVFANVFSHCQSYYGGGQAITRVSKYKAV